MTAVIYARYSSDNQREESIEGQIRECTAYAEKNGITVIKHYIDRAFSAKTDNRPEFQQMIKDSGKKLFDVVLVWKFDRFARNRFDSANYKMILKKNGVHLISVMEPIAEGSQGILVETLLEGMAEYYSAELSEKVIRGQTENALKGKCTGGTGTIGYKIDGDKFYHLDPLTAPLVLEAFQRYDNGDKMVEIVNFLNDKGVRNMLGGKMTHSSVNTMLKNRRYIGELSFRDIVVPDAIPVIVPKDLFDRVQKRLDKNKRAPACGKADEEYLLTTKLFCGKCGALMFGESGTSATGRTYYYYKCANVKRRRGCNKRPGQGRTLCPGLSARCGGRQPSILRSTKSPTILSSWLTACSAPLAILRAVRRIWRWLVLVAMTPAAPSAAPAAMPIRSGAVELVCSFFIGGTPFESKFLGCEDSISTKGFTIRFFCAGKCGILYDMLINWAGYGLAWFMGKGIFCEGGFFFAEDNGTEKSSLHP